MTLHIARTLELADLETDVDRREIVAYASVFNQPVEIMDQHGHYWESIGRAAFDVTIRDAATRVRALVNHGRDIHGQPSDRFSMPYGTVVSMVPDGRGLLTVTRVAETDLGDEILELLRSGAMDGFSFSGRLLQSSETPPARAGDLPLMTRTEIALREFGPAVFPAYPEASLVATRSGHPTTSDGTPVLSDPSTPPAVTPAEGSDTARTEPGPASPPQAAERTPNAAHQWLRQNLR